MLSKCANPACAAKFRYLHTGKLFVARYSAFSNRAAAAPDFGQTGEQWRCFWLCSDCFRHMTIQASRAGGVRLARASSNRMQNNLAAFANAVALPGNPEAEDSIVNLQCKLDTLIKELEFLNSGGYRTALGWRPTLVFEDSPICPKSPISSCPHPHCVLMGFVPEEHKNQAIPCRHIPLNQAGENLHSLYNTATMEEVENTLRQWLETQVVELKKIIASTRDWGEAAA